MYNFYRRVVVETEEPSEVNPVGVVDVRNEWLYEGLPLGLALGGARHLVMAKEVAIEVVIDEPECPSNDRVAYLVRSTDGRKIDTICLMQSWVRESYGLRRYESQSFPCEDTVSIPEDHSFLDCLTIELPREPTGPHIRIMFKDYLEQQREKQSGKPAE